MFDTFKVSRPDTCIKRCQSEPNCQSLNYVIEGSICELNDRSKETRPDDYVIDPKRIYMSFPFNRGMCSYRKPLVFLLLIVLKILHSKAGKNSDCNSSPLDELKEYFLYILIKLKFIGVRAH